MIQDGRLGNLGDPLGSSKEVHRNKPKRARIDGRLNGSRTDWWYSEGGKAVHGAAFVLRTMVAAGKRSAIVQQFGPK